MAPRKYPCTCRKCKTFWTYRDEHGAEHPGRMRDRKIVQRHKRRDRYEATRAQKSDATTLTPEATVLLATISNQVSPMFQESVAVRPRDESNEEEQVSCESRRHKRIS